MFIYLASAGQTCCWTCAKRATSPYRLAPAYDSAAKRDPKVLSLAAAQVGSCDRRQLHVPGRRLGVAVGRGQSFDIGVEAIYQQLQSAQRLLGFTSAASANHSGCPPAGCPTRATGP